MAIPTTTVPGSIERDRPVLELPAGISLGPQIRQLLELERALQRDREADLATEEEEVAGVGQLGGHVVDVTRPRQCLGHEPGQRLHRGEHAVDLGRRQRALDLGQVQAEHLERDDLRQVALRRRHADFGSGPRVEDAVGGAGHGGVDHVGHDEDLGAEAGGLALGL